MGERDEDGASERRIWATGPHLPPLPVHCDANVAHPSVRAPDTLPSPTILARSKAAHRSPSIDFEGKRITAGTERPTAEICSNGSILCGSFCARRSVARAFYCGVPTTCLTIAEYCPRQRIMLETADL